MAQSAQNFSADRVIVSREIKARYLGSFRGWNESLCHKEMWDVGKRQPFGRRKLEAGRVIERIAGQRGKSRIPHQIREESGVGRCGGAPHIARAATIRSDDPIVFYADRD